MKKFNCEHLLSQYLASLCSAFYFTSSYLLKLYKTNLRNFSTARKSLSRRAFISYSHTARKMVPSEIYIILHWNSRKKALNHCAKVCERDFMMLLDRKYVHSGNKIPFFFLYIVTLLPGRSLWKMRLRLFAIWNKWGKNYANYLDANNRVKSIIIIHKWLQESPDFENFKFADFWFVHSLNMYIR